MKSTKKMHEQQANSETSFSSEILLNLNILYLFFFYSERPKIISIAHFLDFFIFQARVLKSKGQ
jgi:hypothetical protein